MTILHVSDWNMQDKYYEVPISILVELKQHIMDKSIQRAWDWFIDISHNGAPIHRRYVVFANTDNYFLDYLDPLESVNEWVFESL